MVAFDPDDALEEGHAWLVSATGDDRGGRSSRPCTKRPAHCSANADSASLRLHLLREEGEARVGAEGVRDGARELLRAGVEQVDVIFEVH